jgi:hypothetical protein
MPILAVAAQVAVAVKAEAATIAVEGEVMAAVVTAPAHRVSAGTAIAVGSLDIRLITATVRSPGRRRKNMPLRPKKKSLLPC